MDEELRRKVEKHDCDLYYGNGKPGITTRMALAERAIDDNRESSEKEVEDVKEDMKEFKKDAKSTRMMMLGVILTVLGEIVVKLVMK